MSAYIRTAILTAGKSNGLSNDAPSSSNISLSHQILCCAYNANGTVFVTGSSDTFARVCLCFKMYFPLGHMVHLLILLVYFYYLCIYGLLALFTKNWALAGLECFKVKC